MGKRGWEREGGRERVRRGWERGWGKETLQSYTSNSSEYDMIDMGLMKVSAWRGKRERKRVGERGWRERVEREGGERGWRGGGQEHTRIEC